MTQAASARPLILVVLVGIPGSGKSTFARALLEGAPPAGRKSRPPGLAPSAIPAVSVLSVAKMRAVAVPPPMPPPPPLTAGGSGVTAWRLLREKFGGAGASITTLTGNLTALTAVTMAETMDFSALALLVRTCAERVEQHDGFAQMSARRRARAATSMR